MANEFRAKRVGDKPNSAKQAILEAMQRRNERDAMWTADLCVVTAYDMTNLTVDVVLANDPDDSVYPDVPILSGSGSRLAYPNLSEGTPNDATGNVEGGSYGVLLFPRIDGTQTYADRKQTPPRLTDKKHQGFGEVFIPLEALFGNENPANVLADDPDSAGDRDTLVKGDEAVVWHPGTDDESFWMVKADGTHVMKFPSDEDFFIGTTDKSVEDGDFAAVARDGDSDSTGGSISGTGSVQVSD